jgi:hypothetical protein
MPGSLLLIFFSSLLLSTGMDVKTMFNKAVNDEDKTIELLNFLTRQNPKPGDINYAYLGAAETLMGKHAFNPMKKLSWLDKGLAKLNQAVIHNANHPVPRYLRISVESQVPAFLGKSTHLEEDKKVLLEQLKILARKKDCATLMDIGNAVLSLKVYNISETSLLQELIKQCATR